MQRFLYCGANCFPRRFLVRLERAEVKFDPQDPSRGGRADVGLRCTTAGLFRSQSIRRNAQVTLCFEAAPRIVEVCINTVEVCNTFSIYITVLTSISTEVYLQMHDGGLFLS